MTSRGLHADELDRVFPFHVVIDRGLRVVQLGRSLAKLIPELGVGASLFDHCTLQRPRETLTYEVLRDRGLELCVLAARGSRLVLKGQIIARPDTETLLFLGSPRVTAAEELAQLGLTINDFAIHDAIVDFLFLSHGQQSALAEVREIADRLATLRARDARQNVALESALADSRRELADRRRAEAEGAQLRDQLMHAQKMEAVGTLAGGFAHDMNNVLTSILGGAELLREDIPPAFHEDLDGIIESTQRGAELTRNLLGFARRGKYRRERVELGTVVGELVKLLARTVPKGVTFAVDVPRPGPSVEGDPTLITQALVNLCLNSVDAMRGVGRVTISANQVELGAERATALEVTPGCYVEIGVTDSGSGMDAATIQRIFEPFFTTKDIGRGTGLGLPMVYGTVRSHGGAIEVSSTVGTGTTMRLYLPAVD
ncbi:MAG: ATP-binding protein, partial [Proteobacteria bacterium]|nr:ATP-binding protein [Pseudomonadota bacterium]